MALQGNLEDFNILNIFQMIKLEGKTGRLTLVDNDDLVKVTFDKGSIIYAEGTANRDEARIRGTLVSNSLVSVDEWARLKKEHDDKLKPYWELLAKKIEAQVLIELIKRQVIDTVYNSMRWKRGNYEFSVIKGLKYNDKVMRPMDVDALLMEGCRIADEWPKLVTSIPPMDTFIVKNIIGEDEDDTLASKAVGQKGSGYKASLEYEILTTRGVELADSDVAVLCVIGEGKTVKEILDSARQGHFDSLEAVKRMLGLNIIKPAKKKRAVKAKGSGGKLVQYLVVLVLLVVVFAGLGLKFVSWPATMEKQARGMENVQKLQAVAGLKRIEKGLRIYLKLNGKLPGSIHDLVSTGIVSTANIMDPWKNPYQLKFKDDKFTLYSTGPDTFLATDDIYIPPLT